MIKIEELRLLSLLPPSIKSDPDIQAAATVLDKSGEKTLQLIKKLNFFVNPHLADHDLLDAVAADLHVDFYDKTFSIETKRRLIDESMILHMEKGTAKSVEDLLTTVFGQGEVEEWYEYGGLPYHFRIYTSDKSATNERANEFIRALESVKRKSTVLESITILQSENMNLYFGTVVHIREKYLFKQER